MDTESQNQIAKASKKIESFTHPLLRVDSRNLPDVFASCVFIEVDSVNYLVTAAHAYRGQKSGLLTRGDGRLIDVEGRATVSESTDIDHFDIAAIRVDDKTIQKHKINVIKKDMFATSIEATNPHCRAVSGFLASKNKQAEILDEENNRITSYSFAYLGFANFQGDFSRFGKSQDRHVGIEFKSGFDDTGKFLSNPPWPPRGYSGGGAWLIPDLSLPDSIFLEGIFIEGYKNSKRMFGFATKIKGVVNFIRTTHNEQMQSNATRAAKPT